MKNKVLLLIIYSENKPSAEYAKEWGRKIRDAIETCQNYIHQFRFKGNVLGGSSGYLSWNAVAIPALRATELTYHALIRTAFSVLGASSQ